MSDPIRREDDGPLAVLTFDHPPLNLFDQAMFEAVDEHTAKLVERPPRGVLFRAEGRVVSGGVNVNEFDGLSVDRARALWQQLLEVAGRIEGLHCPTVFSAHALCLTAAFELALHCDVLLASESAQFGLVERVVGLTPAMGGTQRLAQRAGAARAAEFVMTGGLYDAATLERWGVVNRVHPDADLDAEARGFAMRLAEGPTRAHAATKDILRAYADGGIRGADAVTPGLAGALFGSEDLPNAVRSFLTDGPGKATYECR